MIEKRIRGEPSLEKCEGTTIGSLGLFYRIATIAKRVKGKKNRYMSTANKEKKGVKINVTLLLSYPRKQGA